MATYPEDVLADNPAFFWKLDDSGNTALDSSTLAPTANLTLAGNEGTDYLQQQRTFVRDIAYATQFVTEGAIDTLGTTRHPTGELTIEIWFQNLVAPGTGELRPFYSYAVSGENEEVVLRYKDGAGLITFELTVNGALESQTAVTQNAFGDSVRHQLIVTVKPNAEILWYWDGALFESDTATAYAIGASGNTALMATQSAPGTISSVDTGEASLGAVSVYPSILDAATVLAHYDNGDVYPIFDWEPTTSTLPVQDYGEVTVTWGPGRTAVSGSLSAVYENGHSDAIIALFFGFYPEWEGAVNGFIIDDPVTTIVTYRKKDFRHLDDIIAFRAVATNDQNASTEQSPTFRICGVENYPRGMDPYFGVIIDDAGCAIDCE